MKKTTIFLILNVLFICLCMCGCSSDDSINNNTHNDTSEKSNETNDSLVNYDNEKLMQTATLQYTSQNEDWEYNVYDCYIEITKYIGTEEIDTLIIPDEIESLPVWSYNPGNSSSNLKYYVKSIVFPSKLLVIGEFSFYDFKNLESIVLPNNLIKIEDCAFSLCKSLTDVSLPQTLKTIGHGAFKYCSSLKQITLPQSVEKIGQDSFSHTNDEDGVINNGDGIELTVYNPKLDFSYSGQYEFSIIKGYAGSTAAQFAAKYPSIKFEILD